MNCMILLFTISHWINRTQENVTSQSRNITLCNLFCDYSVLVQIQHAQEGVMASSVRMTLLISCYIISLYSKIHCDVLWLGLCLCLPLQLFVVKKGQILLLRHHLLVGQDERNDYSDADWRYHQWAFLHEDLVGCLNRTQTLVLVTANSEVVEYRRGARGRLVYGKY